MRKLFTLIIKLILFTCTVVFAQTGEKSNDNLNSERISLNNDWLFYKYDSITETDNLIYDVRPDVKNNRYDKDADSKPTEAVDVHVDQMILKTWILPTGNNFIKDLSKRHARSEGNLGSDFPFVQTDFDDSSWKNVNLPRDWAFKRSFMEGSNPEVGGGMRPLPSPGVAWYRKRINIPVSDTGKSIFLHVDGVFVKTSDVSKSSANIEIDVTIENKSRDGVLVNVIDTIFKLDNQGDVNRISSGLY